MKLEWMLLANYAEDNHGLIYIAGGAWDTVNVRGPVQEVSGAPPGAVAILSGYLVVRLLLHITETGMDHHFTVTFVDEDGSELAKAEVDIRAERPVGLPPGWDQGINMVLPITGIGVMKFGAHQVALQVNGQHIGDKSFRVLKLY